MSLQKKITIISYVFNLSNTVRAYAVYDSLKSEYETQVLYADYDHYSKQYVTFDNKNFKSIHVPGYKKNISLMRMVSTVLFGIKSLQYLKRARTDFVYVVCPPNFGAFLVSFFCKKTNIPCIIDIVDLHPESIPLSNKIKKIGDFFGLFLWKKFRNLAIKNADEVIVECNYYKNFIASSFHDKVQTIYIAKQSNLQIVKFETVREHEISILYLGSIGHIYDFETLISLGRGLVKRNIPIKIHIIGDGEKRNWLIENLEVESIPYIYYGKIFEESNKKKIMEMCDFGFNGFKDETSVGLSYKSLDYMDYGLALINSTKEDTWNLINENQAGLNYFADDVDSLINNLVNLAPEDVLLMKKNSRKLFEKYFDRRVFESSIRKKMKELI